MNSPIHRQTIVLIVRVWAEYLNEQPPCWRGVIEGCDPKAGTPFTDLAEMTALIRQQTMSQIKMADDTENPHA